MQRKLDFSPPQATGAVQGALSCAQFSLIIALLLSPLIFVFSTFDNYGVVKITVLWVMGVIATAFWVSWAAERAIWLPKLRLFLPAAAFLAACTLSTVFSISPAFSLLGRYGRHGGLVPILLYAAIGLVVIGLFWERTGELSMIAQAVALTTFLSAIYIIVQAAGRDWGFWRPGSTLPFTYPPGSLGNSNFSGAYLGIGIPLLIYSLATAKGVLKRTAVIGALGTVVAGLWLTHTRGGIMAGGAGLLAMAYGYRDRLPGWIKAVAVTAAGAGAVTVAWVVWNPAWLRAPRALSHLWLLGPSSLQSRFLYWQAAWWIFLDHPVVGTGLDTYYAHYPLYRSALDGARYGLVSIDKPHNIFLEYAANGGALAAVSYLALVGMALWYGYRRVRRLQGKERLLLVAFLGMFAAYLAQGLFSIDIPPLAVMGWVALGAIAAIADPGAVKARGEQDLGSRYSSAPPDEGEPEDPGPAPETDLPVFVPRAGPLRWPVRATAAVLAIALIGVGVRPLLADLRLPRQGPAAAIKLDPREAFYRVLAGGRAEHLAISAKPGKKEQLLEEALMHYQDALALQPRDLLVMTFIARIHQAEAATDPRRFAEADRWWAKIVASDPTDWDVKVQYAAMLYEWAQATGDEAIQRRSDAQLAEAKRIKREFG